MSLIVEDGTGIENANSFVDVVYADDYFSTRGVADWALLTQEQKEVFLIKDQFLRGERGVLRIRNSRFHRGEMLHCILQE